MYFLQPHTHIYTHTPRNDLSFDFQFQDFLHFIQHLYKDLIVFVFIINEIVMSCFITFSFIIVCLFGFFFWCEKTNYIIYIEDWIFYQLIHWCEKTNYIIHIYFSKQAKWSTLDSSYFLKKHIYIYNSIK